MNTEEFKRSLQQLLAEAFGVLESESSFFLDSGQSGLIGQIATLSAEAASHAPDQQETIAAHCGHVLFLLRLFDQYEQGQQPQPDWAASWATQSVDTAAWAQLRADLQSAYEMMVMRLQARSEWPERALAAWMMLLAHVSYHVGVIDKLRSLVSA